MNQLVEAPGGGAEFILDPDVTPNNLNALLGVLAFVPNNPEGTTNPVISPETEATVQIATTEGTDSPPEVLSQPPDFAPAPIQTPVSPPSFDTYSRDRELISIAKSDSPDAARAFGELFASKSRILEAHLISKIPNFADRADTVQEVALKAFKGIKKYDPNKGTAFTSWLLTIATRAAIDLHRHNSARPQIAPDSDPDTTLAQFKDSGDVADQVLAPLGFEWILDKVAEIEAATGSSREFVDILTHVYKKDMSVKEYAALKGIPYGTAKSRLSEAYNLIKKILPSDSRPSARNSV